MALKGSLHKVIPYRHHKINETRSKVSETLPTVENNSRTYDILSVPDKKNVCINTNGLTGPTRSSINPKGLAGLARGATSHGGTQARNMIAVLAIGILLFSTLTAIIAGVIGHHLRDSSNEEARGQPLVADNAARNQYTSSIPNNNSESAWEHLININHELLQLVNTSRALEDAQNKYTNVTGAYCPPGWLTGNNSCYLFANHFKTSFTQSQLYCQQHHSSHLVEVETEAENLFLREYLRGRKDTRYWLGITDERTEDVWRWFTSDTVASYFGWANNEPNGHVNYEEDCAVIIFSNADQWDYHWVDVTCSKTEWGPICELSTAGGSSD